VGIQQNWFKWWGIRGFLGVPTVDGACATKETFGSGLGYFNAARISGLKYWRRFGKLKRNLDNSLPPSDDIR
jgi:hypothetical protein